MGTPGSRSGSGAHARLRKFGGALGAAAVLLVLAVLLPKAAPFAADSSDSQVVRPDLPAIADYLLVVIAFLVAVAAVVIRLRIVGRVTKSAPVRRPLWMQLVTMLLFFLVLGAATERLREQGLFNRDRRTQGEAETPPAAGEAGREQASSRTLGLLITALYLAVVGGLILAIFLMLKRDGQVPIDEDPAPTVLEALERGRRDLQGSDDPRAVVIRTYLAMEAALISGGARRSPSDTAQEFVSNALAELHVPEDSARRLTEIFERARFSSHEIPEGMRDEALAAFERVAASLSKEQPV